MALVTNAFRNSSVPSPQHSHHFILKLAVVSHRGGFEAKGGA